VRDLVSKVLIRYYLHESTLITEQLLEGLGKLLRGESQNLLLKHGLQPVQFEALQYLALCNLYSNTLMAVTEFFGQAKGSVSQTFKVIGSKRGCWSK